MAKAGRSAKRGIGSRLFGLINPIRDPSLLIAIILTVIEQGASQDQPWKLGVVLVLNWIAVKGVIWLLVNFAFSFVYLLRKSMWILRNPRLSWRLLDALGTEEIIIGGLRPDMFATEDGALHEGQLGYAGLGALAAPSYGPPSYGRNAPESEYLYDNYGRQPQVSERLSPENEDMRESLATYSRLLGDWMQFTEEKWRAVSDSQLGWKPLRGRWNGWEEIYLDAFGADDRHVDSNDPMIRRFENSSNKGSAASAVACFLHDMDQLRQQMALIQGGDAGPGAPRIGPLSQGGPVSQRTGKAPIIRNPMIVESDNPQGRR